MSMTRVYRLGMGGGTVKLVVAVAISALLAGCSSSMNRFGPFDGTQANPDPGYSVSSSSSGSVDRTYTSTIPPGRSSAYSNSVETAPLEPAAPRYAETRTTYAPARATYTPERKNYASAKAGTVMVSPGDTLYSLSRAHNVDVKQLIAANNIEAPYNIKVGQTLRLPGSGGIAQGDAGRCKPSCCPARRDALQHFKRQRPEAGCRGAGQRHRRALHG